MREPTTVPLLAELAMVASVEPVLVADRRHQLVLLLAERALAVPVRITVPLLAVQAMVADRLIQVVPHLVERVAEPVTAVQRPILAVPLLAVLAAEPELVVPERTPVPLLVERVAELVTAVQRPIPAVPLLAVIAAVRRLATMLATSLS